MLINHARFPFQKAWLMLNWITPPWLIVDHYSLKTQLTHLHLYTQRIGLGEHLQEHPIFNGNIDGFRLRFSRENQSIDIHISIKFNQSIHLSGEKTYFTNLNSSASYGDDSPYKPWFQIYVPTPFLLTQNITRRDGPKPFHHHRPWIPLAMSSSIDLSWHHGDISTGINHDMGWY